ncbi:MAG: DUF456 domain-containing protein [Actinomycetota bacterium]
MAADVWWTVLAAVLMVIGLCGVVVPILPGLVLMWVVALVYGLLVGFDAIGIVVMVVATILVAASLISSVLIPRRAAAEGGASGWAQVGGIVGAVIGFFVIPVVGIIVGALIGLLVVEAALTGDWGEAWVATKATAKGFGISALVDLGLGLVLLAAWSVWAATVVF